MPHTIRYEPADDLGKREANVVSSDPPMLARGSWFELVEADRLREGQDFSIENQGVISSFRVINVVEKENEDGTLDLTFDLIPIDRA